jgi:hypothetical protein
MAGAPASKGKEYADPPCSLDDIKMELVCMAIRGGFFLPLKSFMHRMHLQWGNTKTAHATLKKGNPVIELGRKFFAEQVLNRGPSSLRYAAQIVLHEILHHLMMHLKTDHVFKARGISHKTINIGEDAIINSFLAKIGEAGFMEIFYNDESYYAFLRPNSKNLNVLRNSEGTENGAKSDRDPGPQFYSKLQSLKMALEESVEFFHKYFRGTDGPKPLIGTHSSEEEGDQEERESGAEEGEGETIEVGVPNEDGEGEPSDASIEIPVDSIFGRGEALDILRFLKLGNVSREAKDNFNKIIADITQSSKKPGAVRTATQLNRRMPAKLTQYDMLSVERGRNLFRQWSYKRRKFLIAPDLSGSMGRIIPFLLGLTASLNKAENDVECCLWADKVGPCKLEDLGTASQPNVGGGTNGEALAQWLATHPVTDVVIITDNEAGSITTRIKARVHLCLVPNATESGSFLDRGAVPHCKTHKLKVDDEYL